MLKERLGFFFFRKNLKVEVQMWLIQNQYKVEKIKNDLQDRFPIKFKALSSQNMIDLNTTVSSPDCLHYSIFSRLLS